VKEFLVTDDGDISDGHHTFRELYRYRLLYNALLFNEWSNFGLHDTHKSKNHHDGEPAFGGGWFIVVAQLPTGQISNHYKLEFWDLFKIEARELPAEYDGHTPAVAADRMERLLRPGPTPCPEGFHWIGQPATSCDECGLPAWEHEGMATSNRLESPFHNSLLVLRPWNPGEREEIKAKWGPK